MGKKPRVIEQFTQSVSPLGLTQQSVKGDILVIGHGPAIPERAFFSTKESQYQAIKPSVNSLVLVDSYGVPPAVHLQNRPIEIRNPYEVPTRSRAIVQSYPWDFQVLFLPEIGGGGFVTISDFFDAILMLRIPNLEDQLTNRFMGYLQQLLKKNGTFIASGSMTTISAVPESPNLRIEWAHVLPNPDLSGYPFVDDNIGFLLRKRS